MQPDLRHELPCFQLDYDSDGWVRKAYRILDAGGTLVGVPGDQLDRIRALTDNLDQELLLQEENDGWRAKIDAEADA